MIRLLIVGLIVLMAGNANAASNEFIYKNCKKFADSGFDDSIRESLVCTMYFVGVRDAFAGACEIYKGTFENSSEDEKFVLEFFALEPSPNINAGIQDYVNKMQQNPQLWNYSAGGDVGDSLRKMSPCEPE